MSRGKKQSKRPTSLLSFPKLPLEVQDEIWKFALENDVPAAHIVNIAHEHPFGQHLAIPRQRLATPFQQHLAAPVLQRLTATGYSSSRMKPVFPAREALMQTCQRSRLIVEKIIKQWELYHHPAAQSMQFSSLHEYDIFHSKKRMKRAPSLQKIYTSRDLFIISTPWNIPTPWTPSQRLNHQNPPPRGISVKYAAIPYLPGDRHWGSSVVPLSGHLRSQLDHIFDILDHLQILYILIHPDEFRKGEQLEVLSLLPAMKQHLDRYKRSREETSPNKFQYGNRVYHEISDVLLLKLIQLGGLPQAVTYLERIAKDQRAKNGGDKPPLIIRFMTW
ncbi:hypothetical protein FLAG1_09713 [Fusarium langsethiae]|uniref:2EXR domain-containing protein n=1 Tax=Fusarium langsethiae TaxID=179993 RepID=A0A0M9EQD2_FUSLA|nr:hypothetical protein FLAG1_09713 [Fusarium langsethiae]GKU06797.1 unnamed protein product [Fusarium langsethiae]GKU22098.1 unnamed protein product [Fusarium langsethiae]